MSYEVYADEKLLYSQAIANSEYSLFSPSVEYSQLGNSGSLGFTMAPKHPLYDYLKPFNTEMRVEENKKVLFRGRILSLGKDNYRQMSVKCEGDLGYLQDSPIQPGTFSGTIRDVFTRYINEHNSRVEAKKQFAVGIVNVDGADSQIVEVESSEYRMTRDAIDSDLIEVHGGYLRTRSENGIRYIDYIKEYGRTSSQVIRFGDNLIDLSDHISCEDIFTILIPEGDDGLNISSVNDGSDCIEIPEAIAKWGRVYKRQSFNGINDPAKLKSEGLIFIKSNYDGNPLTITIKAVDLHRLNVDIDEILIGDRVRIVSIPHKVDAYYVCTSITYDIQNPGNSQFVFGKTLQSLSKKYSDRQKEVNSSFNDTNTNLSKTGAGLGATTSKLDQYIKATDDTLSLHHKNIQLNADKIAANAEQINLRAMQTEVDSIGERVTTVELDLNGKEGYAGIKAQLQTNINDTQKTIDRLSYAGIYVYETGQITLSSYVNIADTFIFDENGVGTPTNRVVQDAFIRIDANKDMIEANAGTIKLKADIVELEATETRIKNLIAQSISAVKSEIQVAISDSIVTRTLNVSGATSTNSLHIAGNTVKQTSIPVVTSFTQASGGSGSTTSYTILTTAVSAAKSHTVDNGKTITSF